MQCGVMYHFFISARNRYYILFWENLFQNQSDRIIPDGSIIDNTCEVTYNARLLPNALAVLFHHSSFDSTDIAQIPMYRYGIVGIVV